MATKNLIPRGDGEGGIGIPTQAWGSGYFNELTVGGNPVLTSFTETNDLTAAVTWANVPDANITQSSVTQHSGSLKIDSDQLTFNSSIVPESDATHDIGSSTNRVRDLYLTNNSLHLGDAVLSSNGSTVHFPSGIVLGGTESVSINTDDNGRLLLGPSGLKVGAVELKPDPDNPKSLFFNEIPQVKDAEGNAVTVLTADKLGLGTSNVLTGINQDLVFKLLTDEQRFVIGTTGEYGLNSGWYRFNDFNVKGATDIGAFPINPVDTRIYSDETSFILFTTDNAGNRVAHLVGGEEEVNANNQIALGIAVKVDDGDTPEDIEFVHTDGESYSVINGDSDSLGTNGLPIRQGFQAPSIGANPAPLLIDGGYF